MKTLVISDMHFPFQDDKALELVDKFIKKEKPDNIVINGDLVDCYSLSSFAKDPRLGATLSKEVAMAREYLAHLNKISKAKKYYVFGNHSIRMNRYLIKQAPELLDFLDLQGLLETDGWEIVNCSNIENYVKIEDWYVGHFDRVAKHSAMTAKNIVADRGVNIVQGHTHRLGAYYVKFLDRTLRGLEGGCLCTLTPTYMASPNWQQGFVLIENKNAYPIEIINHSFTWNGKTYTSDK